MENKKIFTTNRKASFSYLVEEIYTAGIKLLGPEVKSIINSNCSIGESYIDIDSNGEAWLLNCHIDEYKYSSSLSSKKYNPTRKRKLLLNKSEINKLQKKVKEKGYTIVPLTLEYVNKKIKITIGLAKGKNTSDKRNTLKEKEMKRDMQRENKYK
jgi:SsrA-binding protein